MKINLHIFLVVEHDKNKILIFKKKWPILAVFGKIDNKSHSTKKYPK
jgi:hypothetical protein